MVIRIWLCTSVWQVKMKDGSNLARKQLWTHLFWLYIMCFCKPLMTSVLTIGIDLNRLDGLQGCLEKRCWKSSNNDWGQEEWASVRNGIPTSHLLSTRLGGYHGTGGRKTVQTHRIGQPGQSQSSEHNRIATLVTSQELWLSGQDLHQVKSVQDIPAWKKRRSPVPRPI